MTKQKYTNEELLDIIKAKAEELGRTPIRDEVPQKGTIYERFGSWTKALEAAGMRSKYKRGYTKEELLDILKAKAEELGRTPVFRETQQARLIAAHFGGWTKALEAAGLSIKYKQNYTKEELLDIFKAKTKELGRVPFYKELPQADTLAKHFGNWDKVAEVAGMKAIDKRKYTDEDLLDIVKAKAKELGRAPFTYEVLQADTITKRFGSWAKALEMVGMRTKYRRNYTNEELLEIIKEKAEELGRTPHRFEISQGNTICRRFGSWEKALELAGLSTNRYTKERLLEILKAKAEELGRVPLSKEISQASTIVSHFGSWAKALEAAGMESKYKQNYTKEELLDIIKAKAKELGRVPHRCELPQEQTIAKNFGSWDNALKAIGMEIVRKAKYTEEELLEILKAKTEELGRAPLHKELTQAKTIVDHFGSWDKALEAVGMNSKHKLYTKEELLDILKAKTKELGRAPTHAELTQKVTIIKHFGSWENALKLAGITPHYEKDLVGQKFGRLTVLEKSEQERVGYHYVWICQCECGNITKAGTTKLIKGYKRSCGCMQKEGIYKAVAKNLVENTHLGCISSQKLSKANTSGVKGVSWTKSNQKWCAEIVFQGKKHILGYFDKIEDAAKARKAAEEKYFKPIIEKYKDRLSRTDTR